MSLQCVVTRKESTRTSTWWSRAASDTAGSFPQGHPHTEEPHRPLCTHTALQDSQHGKVTVALDEGGEAQDVSDASVPDSACTSRDELFAASPAEVAEDDACGNPNEGVEGQRTGLAESDREGICEVLR